MPFYPRNTNYGATLSTDAGIGVTTGQMQVAVLTVAAAAATVASTTGIHAAVTDNGAQQVVTTAITQPSVPRGITATAGGTAGDIKAIQVIIAGTNYAGAAITETLPAFTVDTAGTVQGSKAFKTVTSITIPAHDGTGATTAIGFNEKIGLPDKLPTNTVLMASLGGTKEATPPTVVTSTSALESNTVDLNSALNSSEVKVFYMV